jgi:O-acetylhomoserine (thiol)-lyase
LYFCSQLLVGDKICCKDKDKNEIDIKMKKQTQAIHLAYERRDAYDSLSVPVYNTLAYEFDNAQIMSEAFTDKIKAPDYSRVENPTVTNFERRVAALTGAHHATAFNSGMAAISNTFLAWIVSTYSASTM